MPGPRVRMSEMVTLLLAPTCGENFLSILGTGFCDYRQQRFEAGKPLLVLQLFHFRCKFGWPHLRLTHTLPPQSSDRLSQRAQQRLPNCFPLRQRERLNRGRDFFPHLIERRFAHQLMTPQQERGVNERTQLHSREFL